MLRVKVLAGRRDLHFAGSIAFAEQRLGERHAAVREPLCTAREIQAPDPTGAFVRCGDRIGAMRFEIAQPCAAYARSVRAGFRRRAVQSRLVRRRALTGTLPAKCTFLNQKMVSRSRPPTITRSTTTSNTSGDDT
jgi:hypothetical protein